MVNDKKLEELLLNLQAGKESAFEQIYRMTDQSVFAYLLSIIRNRDTAQDLMQDAYLKIRSNIHSYQPQGKPLAWIFTICRNLALGEIRRINRTTQQAADPSQKLLESGYEEHLIEGLVLRSTLSLLGSIDRQILLLHVISGMKHREIALFLQLPLGTVLWRYNRAIKILRIHLA